MTAMSGKEVGSVQAGAGRIPEQLHAFGCLDWGSEHLAWQKKQNVTKGIGIHGIAHFQNDQQVDRALELDSGCGLA